MARLDDSADGEREHWRAKRLRNHIDGRKRRAADEMLSRQRGATRTRDAASLRALRVRCLPWFGGILQTIVEELTPAGRIGRSPQCYPMLL